MPGRPQSALPISGGPEAERLEKASSEKKMDILRCVEPRIPQYLPLHIKAGEVKHIAYGNLGGGGAADQLRGSLGAMFKKMVAKPVAAYGATMNTSEKVLSYVDKQVRKEILEAVRTADVPLLKNFVE